MRIRKEILFVNITQLLKCSFLTPLWSWHTVCLKKKLLQSCCSYILFVSPKTFIWTLPSLLQQNILPWGRLSGSEETLLNTSPKWHFYQSKPSECRQSNTVWEQPTIQLFSNPPVLRWESECVCPGEENYPTLRWLWQQFWILSS